MKGIYCERDTRQRSDCKFNVDCNNFKYADYDYVKPLCPANIDNLSSCGINDKSKRCSTYQCNFEKHKQENDKLNTRNKPFTHVLPVEPYRPKFDICNTYTDLNSLEENQLSEINSNSIKEKKIHNDNNNIFKKNNSTSFYEFDIEIDSNFKFPSKWGEDGDIYWDMNEKNRILPEEKIDLNPNKNTKFSNSKCLDNSLTLIKNPNKEKDMLFDTRLSENISLYNSPHIPDKCNDEYICTNQVNSNYTPSKLKFYYPDFKKPCSTGCLPQHHNKLPKHIPPSYSSDTSKFTIGPDRRNHKEENLWNNVTRRKHIS